MRVLLGCVLVVVTTAVGSCGLGSGVLSSGEVKQLFLQLPYRYRWQQVALPEGASGALAGTAIGKHHTIIHFGVALGRETKAVPVPQGVPVPPVYYSSEGYVFSNDLEVPGKNGTVRPGKQFHTAAQWDEAATMVVEMEEKLCRATTGKPCSI
jgi:hypothetical protein